MHEIPQPAIELKANQILTPSEIKNLLEDHCPKLAKLASKDLDEAGFYLEIFARQESEKRGEAAFSGKEYWNQFKAEAYKALCKDDDPKHAELRSSLSGAKAVTSLVGVPLLAASLAQLFSLPLTLVTAFLLVLLHSVLSLGKGAWCECMSREYESPNQEEGET